MPLSAAELKLGFELFSQLLSWVGGKRRTKRMEQLKSHAFQELLKGDAADLDLVRSILRELHKAADTTAKSERLKSLYHTVEASESARPSSKKKPTASKPRQAKSRTHARD